MDKWCEHQAGQTPILQGTVPGGSRKEVDRSEAIKSGNEQTYFSESRWVQLRTEIDGKGLLESHQ